MAHQLIELGRKSCPAGKIRRDAYTTKKGTRVKSTCVKDVGKKGKTPKSEQVLPEPKAGKLKGWKAKQPAVKRRKELRKVAKQHGCKDAVLDLNLLANYTKRTSPSTHRKARADMAWLRKQKWCAYTHKKKVAGR